MAPRRPARRRTYRRRLPRSAKGWWIVLVLAVVVIAWIVQEIGRHPVVFILTALILTAAITAGIIIYRRRQAYRQQVHAITSYTLDQYQRMGDKEFEHALAQLCRRDGCTNVRVVGGKGDLGADVICTTPTGLRLVIQAKRFAPTTKVGSGDVQKVNGTYQHAHGAQLAAIVTTSGYTKDAADYARHCGIRAYDGAALGRWASRTGPAPWH